MHKYSSSVVGKMTVFLGYNLSSLTHLPLPYIPHILFMNFIANHAHITCTAVYSNKDFPTLKFMKPEFSLCQQTGESHIICSLADKQLLNALQVINCGCAHSGTKPLHHTCTACKNLDNFAIVSVFTGQPPPMTTSGAAVLPVTFSVAEVV